MPQARDADGKFIPLVTLRDRDMAMLRFIAMDAHPPPEWEEMAEACGYHQSVMLTQFHRFQKIGLVDERGAITALGLQALVMIR